MTQHDEKTDVLIQLEPNPIRGTQDVSLSALNIVAQSEKALNNAIDTVRVFADTVIEKMEEFSSANRPDEISVEFGLKLTADAKVYVVNSGVEGQLKVVLKWKNKVTE